jgi:predicted MFS family arabinose efflux permease
MAGLLCGILLARTAAGFLGDALGWRAVYITAAIATLTTGFVLFAELPHRPPTLRMPYPKLMHSMLHLARTQPSLWTASIVSALSFGGFTAFWTTLSFLMKSHFHRGASEAGMFGIVGVVGALAAPLAGKLSDRRGSAFTVTLSLAASVVAFGLMWVSITITGLIIGVLLMDLGVQSIQVAEQALVMSLVPEARSRINTLYMVARFMGGAAGSFIGAQAWSHAGWPGVCAVSIGLLMIATIVHAIGP